LVEEIVYRFGVSLRQAVSGTCPRHVAPERYERQEYPRARCSSPSEEGALRERGGDAAPSNYFHPAARRKSRHYERALATPLYYGCTRCTARIAARGSRVVCVARLSRSREINPKPDQRCRSIVDRND